MREKLSLYKLYEEKARPLILDGAMGSLLQDSFSPSSTSLWASEVNVTKPDKVKEAHKNYIESGADIITTNTFRTNPAAYANSNLEIDNREFVKISVELALQERGDRNVLVAGSNAPAEDCYQVERKLSNDKLIENHSSHITYLWESGVDFILNETFGHFDEIKIVAEFCSQNNIPFIVSLYLNEELKLLSGEDHKTAINFLGDFKPLAIGINCISPALFSNIDLLLFENSYWGFYLNCGGGNVTDEIITCGISPEDYIEVIKHYLPYNPIFIGSCCGSSPAHTKALRKVIDEIY